MPQQIFEITDPRTGMVLEVEGDREPTQEEAAALFQQAQQPETQLDVLESRLQEFQDPPTPPEGPFDSMGALGRWLAGAAKEAAPDIVPAALESFRSSMFGPADVARTEEGREALVDLLPAAGALGAGALTGGVGLIPAAAAAAGGVSGRLASEGLKRSGVGGEPSENLTSDLATEAVFSGALPLAGGALSRAGRSLLRRGVKPTKSSLARFGRDQAKSADAALDTMIQERALPTAGGVRKIQSRIAQVEDDLGRAIEQSGAAGKTINPEDVARRLDDLSARTSQQVTPESDLSAIRRAREEFLKGPERPISLDEIKAAFRSGASPSDVPSMIRETRPPIPLSTAQAMKVGTGQRLRARGRYGELSAADEEAQKALARGLKEEIEAATSGIAPVKSLNEELSRLYPTEDMLQDALRRIAGHDVLGLRDVVGATRGSPLALASILSRSTPQAVGGMGLAIGGGATPASGQAMRLILQQLLEAEAEPGDLQLPAGAFQ